MPFQLLFISMAGNLAVSLLQILAAPHPFPMYAAIRGLWHGLVTRPPALGYGYRLQWRQRCRTKSATLQLTWNLAALFSREKRYAYSKTTELTRPPCS